jgi:hypothetical protein
MLLALAVSMSVALGACAAPEPEGYPSARTAAGHPDLQGVWQVRNTANWDLQDHPGALGTLRSTT